MSVSKLFVEGYILNDNTMGYDMEKFYDRKSSLFISGFSGSGKTTLAKVFSKKYNIPYFNLDSFGDKLREKVRKDYNLKEDINLFDFMENNLSEEERNKYYRLRTEWEDNQMLSREIMIYEGIQIAFAVHDDKNLPVSRKILKSPLIIVGTSLLKSSLRAVERDKDKEWYNGYFRFLIDRTKLNLVVLKIQETLRIEKESVAKTTEEINW